MLGHFVVLMLYLLNNCLFLSAVMMVNGACLFVCVCVGADMGKILL